MKKSSLPSDHGLEDVIRRAYAIAKDVGTRVERLVAEDQEMDEGAARELYRKVVRVMKRAAIRRGDERTARKLTEDMEVIVNKVMKSRTGAKKKRSAAAPSAKNTKSSPTQVAPPTMVPVKPRPVFHGRKVDLYERRISPKDIELWARNERIDVHLAQFQALHGRAPVNDELIAMMTGALTLPGVTLGDERGSPDDPFEIEELAANIAKNGLRTPPILDNDGATLLDGNRRITACYYLLSSPEYSAEQKKLVDEITVWQLTEHADDDDRQAVIVALNYESDCKVQWPDYVRAKKLKSEYDLLCMRVGQQYLDDKKEREIRKELAKKFALKGSDVSRFLNMMVWVDKFEGYHIDEQGRDEHEVKHFASNKFSYFKEIADIDHVLKDEDYRTLVFDLFFQGKFRNWESIRRLRYNDEQLERDLRVAHAEPDVAIARKNAGVALDQAYQRHVDKRPPLGVKETIENFAKLLGKLPPSVYLDPETVPTASLRGLKSLCSMVLKNTEEALKARAES